MSVSLSEKYPHIQFQRIWNINNPQLNYLLGECEALIKAICNTPILPKYHDKLYRLSVKKGAQATTAIEGNTLSDREVELVEAGENLPLSKQYQEIEIKNIMDAFNTLLSEVIVKQQAQLIIPEFILRLHKMVGSNLGDHFGAIPGQFRNNNVVVGRYRCPDYQDVEELVSNLTEWLKAEFHYTSGHQSFKEIVIQAIITHIYIEWIHPFGDGNGRTGRLLEFYVLLRGKNPDIASHILSNHYNETRTEYYRQIQLAYEKRDLTEFILYALQGFKDGLEATLGTIQTSQTEITWQKLVYDTFEDVKMVKREVFKRKRALMLAMPLDRGVSLDEMIIINTKIARLYASLSMKSVKRDIDECIGLGLLKKGDNLYYANAPLMEAFMAKAKK